MYHHQQTTSSPTRDLTSAETTGSTSILPNLITFGYVTYKIAYSKCERRRPAVDGPTEKPGGTRATGGALRRASMGRAEANGNSNGIGRSASCRRARARPGGVGVQGRARINHPRFTCTKSRLENFIEFIWFRNTLSRSTRYQRKISLNQNISN